MKHVFVYIIVLLSVTMAALSCSKPSYEPSYDSLTLVVSGVACDKNSGEVLEGIRIHLYAAGNSEAGEDKIQTNSVYTDNRGYFTLTAKGFTGPVSCTITAEDRNGIYGFERQDLKVSWSGTSFDTYTGNFYVNDCNFYMEKMLE